MSLQSAFATTIGVVTSDSGRIGDASLAGNDWQFGTANAADAANGDTNVSFNNALLGDNPSNIKFGQLWRFDVTTDFATDLNNGYDVFLEFTSGLINNGGGTPAAVDVHFLDAGTGLARGTAAATLTSTLGSVSGTSPNTFHSLQVTGLPGGLAAGDRIWIGLDGGLSTNNAANNMYIAGTSSSINAELVTVIPEPGTLMLVGVSLLTLVALRRRR